MTFPGRTLLARSITAATAGIFVMSACSTGGPAAPLVTAGPGTALPPTPSVSAAVVATTASWGLDEPWSRAVVVADGGTLVVYSGLDAAKRSLNRVVRIDPAIGHQTAQPPLPRVLHDAAGTTLAGSIVLIGGGEQETGSREITAVTGLHAGKDLGRLPEPRSDLAAATIGDTAYIVGGYDGKSLAAAVLATTDGTTVTAVGNLNPAVRYPAVAATNAGLWVFGGKTADGQTDAIQRVDPVAKTVSTVGHLPTPIGHAVAFTLNGTIYLAGGRAGGASTDAGNTVTNEIWAFDPAAGAVRPAGALPYAVADAGVAVIADHAYIVGGEKDANDTPVSTVISIEDR
jgi:hypothetical protein